MQFVRTEYLSDASNAKDISFLEWNLPTFCCVCVCGFFFCCKHWFCLIFQFYVVLLCVCVCVRVCVCACVRVCVCFFWKRSSNEEPHIQSNLCKLYAIMIDLHPRIHRELVLQNSTETHTDKHANSTDRDTHACTLANTYPFTPTKFSLSIESHQLYNKCKKIVVFIDRKKKRYQTPESQTW
jgi:hypothetical protein